MSSIISLLSRPLISSLSKPLIEDLGEPQVERITNGDFATGASWVIDSGGWVIGGGEATNVTDSLQLRQITGLLPAGLARLRLTGSNVADAIIRAAAVDAIGVEVDVLTSVMDAGAINVDATVTIPPGTYGIAFINSEPSPGSTIDNVSLIA